MSNTKDSLVSVFLPTYNHELFIVEALESVLAQDYSNIEIIVGDDCSTDNTWKIVQDYQKRYPKKIKCFKNPKNLGITGNCNEILRLCSGKYIVFFAGDDLMLPGKISSQVMETERDSSIVLCYHDVAVFNSDTGKNMYYLHHGLFRSSIPVQGSAKKVLKKLVQKNFIPAMSVIVRRESIPETGFDVRLPVSSDKFMWIEILATADKDAKVLYLKKVLSRYRRHKNNVTNDEYINLDDLLVTNAITESRYPYLTKDVLISLANFRMNKGRSLIRSGECNLGRSVLLKSFPSKWYSLRFYYWVLTSYLPFLLIIRKLLPRI